MMKAAAPQNKLNVFTTGQDKPLLLRSTLSWTTPDCGLAQYSYTHFIVKNLFYKNNEAEIYKILLREISTENKYWSGKNKEHRIQRIYANNWLR